jgi:hypothetical protein
MNTQETSLIEFQNFLVGGRGVRGCLPYPEEFMHGLNERIITNLPIKLFYGETVDELGMPVDSLKYYFFLSIIHRYFESLNIPIESTVIIADIHSLLNDSSQNKNEIIGKSIERRITLLHKLRTVFGLPFHVVKMSDMFETAAYKDALARTTNVLNDSSIYDSIIPFLEKTVLFNRLPEEHRKKFRYGVEAIAVSQLFDMKIGPPREKYYDQAAEVINTALLKPSLLSMYLQPSQPLGQNFAYFLNHPEIEEYGVTPYKAASNKMQDCRIILGQTTLEQIHMLIESSFESLNPETVHPVYDVFLIAEMARRLIAHDNSLDFSELEEFTTVDELKTRTKEKFERYIYEKIH